MLIQVNFIKYIASKIATRALAKLNRGNDYNITVSIKYRVSLKLIIRQNIQFKSTLKVIKLIDDCLDGMPYDFCSGDPQLNAHSKFMFVHFIA